MKNKKKIIVLSTMIVLLVASAFLNVWLNNRISDQDKETPVNNPTDVTTTFSSFRSDRETPRQEIFDYLDAILESETASAEAKTAAENQKMGICAEMEDELLLESLIKSRGFNDVIVTMSTSNVTVVVADDDLQSTEVAQILAIVTDETEYIADNVIVCAY